MAITILPSVRTSRATQIWSISPNSRPYVTTGNTERGLAYNSLSNHVLVISRTGNIDIHVLDGDTGADLWTMSAPSDVVSGSNPGGFRLNMIDVADDGTVYAANLTTGAADTSPYTIYRWENDGTNAAPVAVFSGAPSGERFGDTFTVRGSGLDTQIIATTRNGTAVALFTTTDGQTFTPTIIDTPDAAAGNFGLGIAFGEGNTFWGKGTGDTALLRHVQFDLGSGIGTILQTFTNLEAYVSTIAVSGSSNLLAALALETPDNLRLYDISNTNAEPILIDQDFFPSDNPNINGTGAIDFGRDRVYALDSNNGIIALQLNGGGGNPPQAASLSTPAVAGETFNFALSGSANASYVVQYSTDLKTWSTLKTVIAGADGKAVVSDSVSDQHRFYRAIAE